jgi:hypothetical protein
MSEHSALLKRYQHLRRVALPLNHRVVETLPKNVLDEGGKKLGILKKNVLTLDSKDEIAVLMDYCIYDVRRQGQNAVERYLAESAPAPGSDESILLEAMRGARYCVLLVEALEPGVGVHVRDLLRDEALFLVDVNLSRTTRIGMVLASRVMAPEGIAMTTGAALPVGVLPPAERERFLQLTLKMIGREGFAQLPPQKASDLTAVVIRSCLELGAAEHIAYGEPRGAGMRGPVSAAPPPARRTGRDDSCPCGSGRKFKHCCGARK